MARYKSLVDAAKDILSAAHATHKPPSCAIGTVSAGSSVMHPPRFPPLPEPTKEELLPDQEEMDQLASALTEAVLQLRAGDLTGACNTLERVNGLCYVRITTHLSPVPSHYLDAARYGMAARHDPQLIYQPPERAMTATEALLRQQEAEQMMRQLMENVNTTLHPSHIVSDNTADPTDPK